MSLVLANRRELYRAPGLGDVSNNGGSRINQRLLLMLRKMCTDFGERGLVDELVRAQAGQARRKRKPDSEPEDPRRVKTERREDAEQGERGGRPAREARAQAEQRPMRDELDQEDIKPKIEY